MSDIWMPESDTPEPSQKKSVTAIYSYEMDVLERLHSVAQKYDLVLACERCRRPFQGHNDSTPRALRTIACDCRELRG